MLSLPFSKTKRYLTGIDWIIHVLNYMTKKETGADFMSQIVIEVSGAVNVGELFNRLNAFIKNYPVLCGYASRDINLAPYWKIPPANKIDVLLDSSNVENDTSFETIIKHLEKKINTAFKNKRYHLAFHLINAGDKSFIAMRFDHLIFDAANAEAFLDLFQKQWKEETPFDYKFAPEPAHLSLWMEKFMAGQRVNRAFLKIADNVAPRVLPLPAVKNGFRFKILSFDKKDADTIFENAFNEAGYLMLMPYALAASVYCLHKMFTDRLISSGDYVIPVSINMKKQEKENKQFFNNVSFFIFKIEADIAGNFSAIINSIKKQMYDQVKADFPGDLCKASMLMRIAPLSVLGRLMKIYLKGQVASFSFSYLGEAVYTSYDFMGNNILNLFHMPRVPVPPGIGIFFQRSNERMNVILSYLDGMLKNEEAEEILSLLKFRLGVK
ncbi:MAG: hypothetical protein KJ826_18400 [Proteobacteria bacterium]|nr:hypothetical protein [Pseudomonadota bacterium]MBU4035294.1 hypothetical protein [Pseudomonadota bacterium]